SVVDTWERSVLFLCYVFFFFQAEDGIRDGHVTGVQTCALPIWRTSSTSPRGRRRCSPRPPWRRRRASAARRAASGGRRGCSGRRSEERRVGKECRSGGGPEH